MSNWPFGSLMPFRYSAILADPPWSYRMYSEKGYTRSPEAHYATMSIEDIARLPVGQLAGPDCYLFLWSTWPHLPMAIEVMQAWGFDYITGGAWLKRTSAWAPCMGTGYMLRSATEPYLVGRIGRPQITSRSERNVIINPEETPDLIDSFRREHSRKPPQMRDMIDRLLPNGYFCELFGREPWPGHDVWGNQPEHFGAVL